ncbi:MAG: glutathione S-transferase N-terminal domain-containing protein [Halopseudomonas aestusnigri]
MKLFYSQNSPFARIARVALRECELLKTVEEIEVINRSPDSPLLAYSPVCRVPTFVHDEFVLAETRTICSYFDQTNSDPILFSSSNEGMKDKELETMALGFLEGIAAWVRELRREPENQSLFLLDIEQQRAIRCLQYFEKKMKKMEIKADLSFQNIVLGCALSLMDKRSLYGEWRVERPFTSKWFDDINGKKSMVDTAPI